MAHMMGERGATDSRNEQARSDSLDWSSPPLPGHVPVEPTETSNGRTAQGAMEASPVNKISTVWTRRTSMTHMMGERGATDSRNEQARSDSLEGLCPPLPGHVPVEPTETSNGRTAQGANEASPVNKISTVWTRRTSMTHMMGERGATDSRNEQARSDSLEGLCPPLPGHVPVEPTETSNGRTAQGANEASPVNKISTVWTRRTSLAHMMGERGGLSRSRRAAFSQTADQDPLPDLTQTQSQELPRHSASLSLSEISVSVSMGQADGKRTQQSDSQQSSDDGHPSTSSSSKRSCMDSGHSRSRRTASTDSSLGIMSSLSLSLSSRGSYSFLWRWSGDGSDSRSVQGRSDSLEGSCPPLPDQVPVEPIETSNGRTAQGANEASPVNKISTEKPTECRKGIRSFLQRLWKAVKSPFCCCCLSSAVDAESFKSFYNVGDMIGSGGFGSVYKGTRKFDGKKVAIKQISKIDNNRYLYIPGHPTPLVTEVALLLMMRREPISPHIIRLYEWFENPQTFTLVMEFPEPCVSLLDYVMRKPVLHEPTGRFIMRQALLAVQICIEHGVFHNDIHAQNFLINENTLELKLIDFGCGQLFSRDGYESNTYVGVPHYCPPEVLTEPRFHAVPANVWSLGVLLYTMVHYGCPPFLNQTEIRQANVTFYNYSLSKKCRDLISQCLARDPTKRLTLEQMSQHRWMR